MVAKLLEEYWMEEEYDAMATASNLICSLWGNGYIPFAVC
jgi:hypothetical protein